MQRTYRLQQKQCAKSEIYSGKHIKKKKKKILNESHKLTPQGIRKKRIN